MSWKDEHVETLKKLHADGCSASEISRGLFRLHGADFSRNAVIGKLMRLNLPSDPAKAKFNHKRNRPIGAPRHKPGPVVTAAAPLTAKPKLQIAGNNAVFEQADSLPKLPPVKASTWAPLAGSRPVKLTERALFTCRWPVELLGEAEPHFCGLAAPDDRYCRAHTAMATPRAGTKEHLDQKLGIAPRRRAA